MIDFEDDFYYITDSNLMNELHNQGFEPYDSKINQHNSQRYWRYGINAAKVIHAWMDKQRNKKYNLDRWKLK